MKVQALALALVVPLAGHASALSTIDATKQACAEAAEKFASNQPDFAYSALMPYWPLPEEEIQNLGYQTKAQLAMVGDRFGAMIGAEHVKTTIAGQSLVKHVFLIKREKHAMRFSCVFYRPGKDWLVNAVVWDDKPQNLFGNEG